MNGNPSTPASTPTIGVDVFKELINSLENKINTNLDQTIANVNNNLNQNIVNVNTNLNKNIDTVNTNLNINIATVTSKLAEIITRIQQQDIKINDLEQRVETLEKSR